VCALAGGGAAVAAPPPQRPPIASAPSEYVEVIPTAGGGADVPARSRPGAAAWAAHESALASALDAVEAADRRGAVALGAVLVAATAVLLAVAVRRGHVPNG